MKHPDSFRTTLVQIANEAYEAFMKAHINMEKIQLKMEQVPQYIDDCVKYMTSGKKVIIEKLLPKRLERIKEVAAGGEELSNEVCETFAELSKLIRQVIEASTKTMGDIEIADKVGEKKKSDEEAKKRERENLLKQLEEQQSDVREKGKYLDSVRNRKWNFWLELIGHEKKDKSIEHGQQMKEEAENKLKEIKAEAKECEKKIDQMLKENIERLEKMGIDVNDGISTKQAVETLKEGLKHLADLQKKWYGMTLHFTQIKGHLSEKTSQNLKNFIDNTEVVGEDSTTYGDLMPDSIKRSLESCYQTHDSAKMYVKVSNNYIMKNINQMHGMLTLPSHEVQKAQEKLKASCREASKGIMVMYKEDVENRMHEVKMLTNP